MLKQAVGSLVLALALSCVTPARATTVSFDTSAAKATLAALQEPDLTLDQAATVAAMPGNQGLVRELQGFGIAASAQGFAQALYHAAHGQPATDPVEKSYALDTVKARARAIGALIAAIDGDTEHFQKAIETRIALFTPKDANIHLQGYVVAGGDGGGYAFGGTDFYFNAGMIQDLVLARAVANHEMYHAVQGAFTAPRWSVSQGAATAGCSPTGRLMASLYREGSAAFVEDPSLVNQSTSEIGLRKRADMEEGLKHVAWSASLLEMSITALNAPHPVAYDQVYAVGFYGHGALYTIGYVMAQALVNRHGPPGLSDLLAQPPRNFILAYARLPLYGKDAQHPKLGTNTLSAASSIAGDCR